MANQTPTVQELQALIIALQGQVTALQNAAPAAPAAPTAAVLFAEMPQTLGINDLIIIRRKGVRTSIIKGAKHSTTKHLPTAST